jgi:hypothetical protein
MSCICESRYVVALIQQTKKLYTQKRERREGKEEGFAYFQISMNKIYKDY